MGRSSFGYGLFILLFKIACATPAPRSAPGPARSSSAAPPSGPRPGLIAQAPLWPSPRAPSLAAKEARPILTPARKPRATASPPRITRLTPSYFQPRPHPSIPHPGPPSAPSPVYSPPGLTLCAALGAPCPAPAPPRPILALALSLARALGPGLPRPAPGPTHGHPRALPGPTHAPPQAPS